MNQQAFDAGQEAYRRGNLGEAVSLLRQAKQPGEVSGRIDHLLGNCLMRLGNFDQAAMSYGDALQDSAYGHAGALACNRGRALLAAGRPQEAVASLVMATKDTSYTTPYKAYVALGNAYTQCGNFREAGVAYRNAAIDEANPDPSGALRSLGSCFMRMGRAVDAIEAYRTALDFSTPQESQSAIYEDLGMAYVAAGRMSDAVDAFGNAASDASHQMSAESQAAYEAAQRAVSSNSRGSDPSGTDEFLAAAGFNSAPTGSMDPLDPLGKSGEFMPSPEDTGFFEISEQEMVQQDRERRKVRRKHRGCGCRIFFILFFLLVLLGGGAGILYFNGYGWPMQEAVVEDMFIAKTTADGNVRDYLVDSLTDDEVQAIVQTLPESTSVTARATERAMRTSKVEAEATLAAGGTYTYEVSLVRDGISWKVSDVRADFASQGGQEAKVDDSSKDAQTSADEAAAQQEASESAEAGQPEETSEQSEETAAEGADQQEGASDDQQGTENQGEQGDEAADVTDGQL